MRNRLIYSFKSLVLTVVSFVLLAAVFAISQQATAQTIESLDRLFTIQAVKVDVRSRRASDAQQTALARAEAEAYEKLLLKITQPEGRALLPTLTPAQIRALVSGIEVVSEQSSSRRYIATLDVRFEPGKVSRFLAENGVPHVLSTGRGLVLFHAHKDGLNEYLWQQSEIAANARTSVDWLNRIRKYVFPRGDLRERRLVTYGDLESLQVAGARKVAAYYGVRSLLMVSSEWVATGNGGTLAYKYYSSDNEQIDRGEVQASGPGAQGLALQQMFEQVLDVVDSVWRERLLVDTGTGGEVEALVPTTSLKVLADVERRMADVTLVQNVTILSVGLPFTRIRFRYTGRIDQLILALKFAGLALTEYGDEKLLSPTKLN